MSCLYTHATAPQGVAGCVALSEDEDEAMSCLYTHATAPQGAAGCVALSEDGTRGISGGSDSTVMLWDVARGAQIANLRGHRGQVRCVAMLDERRFLSAGADGLGRVWDVRARSGSCAATLDGHVDAVTCFGTDGSGTQIVTGSRDRTIRVWDIRVGGRPLHTLQGHRDWVTSIHVQGSGSAAVIGSGSLDWTARVWSATSGSCEAVLTGHGGGVTAVHVAIKGGAGAGRGMPPGADDPLADLLMRQVDSLMKEKGGLAQEVDRLQRENDSLHELVGFLSHQLEQRGGAELDVEELSVFLEEAASL
mmetsp:Transcript_62132/g.196517  ORF Transcript_62132/g.196517 Transcript_62132/m.196517 type:complete len:306 (+) Transcript_62132:2-919(+)